MSDVMNMLPQGVEAEEALLGSILIDPSALVVARALKLKPEDFYRLTHQTIFATMRQLDEDGMRVDFATLTMRLERTGQLENAGGSAYILSLVNTAPTSLNTRSYADLIKRVAEGRQVIHQAGDLAASGNDSTDPAKAAVRAVETLAAAQAKDEGLDLPVKEARERMTSLVPSFQYLDELAEQTFPETLWVVPDLLPEGLTLLAAKPKLGKSWLALGLALAVASGGVALGKVPVNQGAVLYLALEDSPKRLPSGQNCCCAPARLPQTSRRASRFRTRWGSPPTGPG